MMTSLALLLVCGAILLIGVLSAGIFALIKMGVIVREAGRLAHHDTGNYTLDQGREVRPEHDGTWR